jgi:DNA modification methylase
MGAGELDQGEFRSFLAGSFETVKPHLTDGALIYAFMDGRHIGDLIEAGERTRFELKSVICWDKGKGGMGAMYRQAHELIALFKHGRAPHINNIMLGKHGRDRQTIWRYAGMNRFGKGRDRALASHATVKPVQMICDLLLDASRPGDIVYDGFGGSGTTLIAAEKMGRRARLIELEPGYCDVAIGRFINAFGEEPIERVSGRGFSELAGIRGAAPGETSGDE